MDIRLSKGLTAKLGERELVAIRVALAMGVQVMSGRPDRAMAIAQDFTPQFGTALDLMLLFSELSDESELMCRVLGREPTETCAGELIV